MIDTACLWLGRIFAATSTVVCFVYALSRVAFYVYKSFVEWGLLVEFFAWKKRINGKAVGK